MNVSRQPTFQAAEPHPRQARDGGSTAGPMVFDDSADVV